MYIILKKFDYKSKKCNQTTINNRQSKVLIGQRVSGEIRLGDRLTDI